MSGTKHKMADPLDSDSEDSDAVELRTSTERREYDRSTISTEEEAERLLTAEGKDARRDHGQRHGRQKSTRQKRKKGGWLGQHDGEGELLYKVEAGGSSNDNSANSSEVDLQHMSEVQAKQQSKVVRSGRVAAIYVIILIAFLALLFGAYKASHHHKSSPSVSGTIAKVLSNGTNTFLPTTILISLDGFRADFLYRNLTPTLSGFVKQGVSPKYMLPSFPSLTFPNHFTLVTGYYPEAHGIVGNTFWDPNMAKEFYYTDPEKSMKPEYWNAEPIWETAELQDLRTAIHMWPGSEAHIYEPTYVDSFNADEPLDNKVRRILGWLDLPGPEDPNAAQPRPQLIAAYVPNVDADGHTYGPNSTYIRSTIAEVDGMLGSLFEGLGERNLTDVVNVVIVSDHGMATTSNHRLIQFEDLVDPDLIEHIDGWPLYGLRPKDQSKEKLQELYTQLVEKSHLPKYEGNFEVYLRDENMPKRYHFTNNARIAPLWIVPKAGWAIVTKDEFNIEEALAKDEIYHPRGLHGYDHEHPLMRAIFVARGPAFPHPQGSEVEPFQNIEVYNIVCDSLGIEPKPNNGTIRLPFKTVGLHDSQAAPEIPDDPPLIDTSSQILPPELPGIEKLPPAPGKSEATDTIEPPPVPQPPPATSNSEDHPEPETPVERPVVADGLAAAEEKKQSWLDWINEELDGARVWISDVFGAHRTKGDSANDANGR